MNLEARFERLEREVRFWRRFSILLAIGGALALLVAAGPKRSRVVTAERYELVDAKGDSAGSWQVLENGPVLTMKSKAGSGMGLGAENGGQQQAFLRMFGPKNSTAIKLESHAEFGIVQVFSAKSPGHYMELVQGNDSGEFQISRDGRVRTRVRTDVARSYLEVKSPSGVPNLFTSP